MNIATQILVIGNLRALGKESISSAQDPSARQIHVSSVVDGNKSTCHSPLSPRKSLSDIFCAFFFGAEDEEDPMSYNITKPRIRALTHDYKAGLDGIQISLRSSSKGNTVRMGALRK